MNDETPLVREKQQSQPREGGELKPGEHVLVRGQVMEVALQHFVVAFEARWPGNAITTNIHVAKESVLRAASQPVSAAGGTIGLDGDTKRDWETDGPALEARLDGIAAQLEYYANCGLVGNANDRVYQAALKIHNAGFELAHELAKCGHARANYRDPNYIPGVSAESDSSKCEFCEALRAGRQEQPHENWQYDLAKEIASDLENSGLVNPGLDGIKALQIINNRLLGVERQSGPMQSGRAALAATPACPDKHHDMGGKCWTCGVDPAAKE